MDNPIDKKDEVNKSIIGVKKDNKFNIIIDDFILFLNIFIFFYLNI